MSKAKDKLEKLHAELVAIRVAMEAMSTFAKIKMKMAEELLKEVHEPRG